VFRAFVRWASDLTGEDMFFLPLSEILGVLDGDSVPLAKIPASAPVVSTVEEAEALLPGEILVTTVTNVGWTPLFPRAAAVVTDIGAPMSRCSLQSTGFGLSSAQGRPAGDPRVAGLFYACLLTSVLVN
jgi:pyruvate,water dikinase